MLKLSIRKMVAKCYTGVTIYAFQLINDTAGQYSQTVRPEDATKPRYTSQMLS